MCSKQNIRFKFLHIKNDYKNKWMKTAIKIVNITEITGGITTNVDVNVKNVIYVKHIIFIILPDIVVNMENI